MWYITFVVKNLFICLHNMQIQDQNKLGDGRMLKRDCYIAGWSFRSFDKSMAFRPNAFLYQFWQILSVSPFIFIWLYVQMIFTLLDTCRFLKKKWLLLKITISNSWVSLNTILVGNCFDDCNGTGAVINASERVWRCRIMHVYKWFSYIV